MILTLMIRRAKGLKLLNYVFITDLNTFGSKVFLTFKIMDFENVALTKSYSYVCDREHECIIYIIYNQFLVKICLYLKCNVKWGIQNIKF